MDPELANWLAHRRRLSSVAGDEDEEREAVGDMPQVPCAPVPRRKLSTKDRLLAEFRDMSYKQFNCLVEIFQNFDTKKEGLLGIGELKKLMESLGAAQTHVALKQMIQQVDEDHDGRITMREFFILYRMAVEAPNENAGFAALANLESFDVGAEGVRNAKGFFEAKMEAVAGKNSFANEIKEEQECRKKASLEKQRREENFKARRAVFEGNNKLLPT